MREEACATAMIFYHMFCSTMSETDYDLNVSHCCLVSMCHTNLTYTCTYIHTRHYFIYIFKMQMVAMAALNLAAKSQEHLTKLGDIVNTCHR